MPIINDSTGRNALLHLLPVRKEDMVENVKVKNSLGYSKREAVEVMICKEESKKKKAELQSQTSEEPMLVCSWPVLRAKGLDIFQQNTLWSKRKAHIDIKMVKQVWQKACKHKHWAPE